MSGTGQAVGAVAGEQFYVTHCVTADSVMNSPGYSVRATSAIDDADALRFALEYPPYELPIELWREKPTKAMAPRRLARTPHPNGYDVWVVHSAFLEKDTMNRDRSYFSHLIKLPSSTDPAEILSSWDSPSWVKDYPPRADKKLRRSSIPDGKAISDESLVDFLSGNPGGPTDLASVVCPVRLRTDISRRKELVLRFLQGVYLVTQTEQDRDRLFVHAEPGLVALLLYAAARLLPPAWVANLTFSTFEPAHRGLRDYQLAQVIGTYIGPSGKGLDADLVTSRGYGLDTLHPERTSKEFSGPFPPGLDELVQLVAAGELHLLADVHQLIGNEKNALGRVSKKVPIARALSRLNSGEPTIDDLLNLSADEGSAAVLREDEEKVWPLVRDFAMKDPRIGTAFKDWFTLPARLDELRRDAAKALARDDLDGWDTRWAVVQRVLNAAEAREQLEKAMKNLDKHLPTLPAAARTRLREACAAANAWPDHHLLAPTTPEELSALLSPQNPPDWQGYTCFAVMGPEEKNWLLPSTGAFHSTLRDRARRHLTSAPLPVLAGYLKHSRAHIAADPVFLQGLLQPHSKASIALLDRLIDAGASLVDASDWLKLFVELNIYEAPEWQGFMFQNDHLAKLLAGFRVNPAATKYWGDYLDLLSAEIFEGDEWELALYNQLNKARALLEAANIELRSVLPRGGHAKLNAINSLLTLINDPASAAEIDNTELLSASELMWPGAPQAGLWYLLHKLYSRGGFDKLDLPGEAKNLEPFVGAFLACFPVPDGNSWFTVRAPVAAWLAVSESCPDEKSRTEFQLHFILKHLSKDQHKIIKAQENEEFKATGIRNGESRVSFTPEAYARIREAAKAPGERYKPRARTTSSKEEDNPDELPSLKRYRKKKQSNSVKTLLVVVVGVVAVIAIALALNRHFRKDPEKQSEVEKTLNDK